MRILWAGVGPWHKTAYGQQTALFAERIKNLLGHDVVISIFGRTGIDDNPRKAHPQAIEAMTTGQWHGIPVIGPGAKEFALPPPHLIREAFGGHDPDLLITLKDAWVLPVGDYKSRLGRAAVWANIDCKPLGLLDRQFFLHSGARPIAVSRHGEAMFQAAGFDPLYVPHGVDTSLFWPAEDKAAAKEHLGLPPGAFIAGICAMNTGTVSRKAFYEQMAGFAQFTEHGRVPNCLLLMHTRPEHEEGIPLRPIARQLGIERQVLFGASDNMTAPDMRTWYQALDVLLAASYGEGFGVPIVEALACGVPVIGSRNSAITEKIGKGCGWLVNCQDWWHPSYEAVWGIPRIGEISAALGKAQARPAVPPDAAARWDADRITLDHWKPALEALAAQ